MDESFVQMRDFIMVTENLLRTEFDYGDDEPIMEVETPVSASDDALLEDLSDVVFKLRAFMESSEGDFALGVETGMQRAADMIENVLARHSRKEID